VALSFFPLAARTADVVTDGGDSGTGTLRDVLGGTNDTEVIINIPINNNVTLTSDSAIVPNSSNTNDIALSGGGTIANTVAGDLYSTAWTNKDVAGYFDPLGTFQSLVADAVADAINNANFGGAVVTMSGSSRTTAAIDDGRTDLGVIYEGVHFTGFDRSTASANNGGGVAGAYSTSSGGSSSSIRNIKNSFFSDNEVTTATYLQGGGVVGAFSGESSASMWDITNNSVFSGNTVRAATYLQGGGVAGAFAYYVSASMGDVTDSVFSGNMITASSGALNGGGVAGAANMTAVASMGNITNSVFRDNTVASSAILCGGGVAGACNIYGGGAASVGAISGSDFSDNIITAGTSLQGGGVVGAYSSSHAVHVGDVSNSIFTRNTIEATSGNLWGGLIYTADDLTIANSTFTDNTFTYGTTFYGTVSIDTSKAGTTGGDGNTGTHTVTLKANSGDQTLFKDNIANITTSNSLAFVNLQTPGTSAASAVLNIEAESGGKVELYDPIKVLLTSGKTFTMNITGAGDFLWGGANVFEVSATDIANIVDFKANSRTTLLPDFELEAPNHAVKVNDTATLGIMLDADRSNTAYIVADSAELAGTLNISGISGDSVPPYAAGVVSLPQYLLIQTTTGISNDFSRIAIGGEDGLGVDYAVVAAVKSANGKNYSAGIMLSWLSPESTAHGTFTLNGEDSMFTVDIPLTNQPGTFTSGWDGKSLTKYGDGTLILSAANNAYDKTTVSAGTLELTGNLTNDTVTVEGRGIFDLSGELTARNITIDNGALFKITGSELTVNEKLSNSGTFDMVSHNGRLYLGPTSRLHNDNGTIILNNGSNILQVGKLSGTGNIQMYVNIAANSGDRIEVDGTATGLHSLSINDRSVTTPTGIEPALLVAQTGADSTAIFTSNSLSFGAFRYMVRDGLAAHVDESANNWYLVRSGYSSPVATYIGGQRVNAETGFRQLANLHQRVGEHRDLPLELQSWARTYRSQGSEDGKRGFGYDQDTSGIQIGQELLARSTGTGGTLRAALAFDAARADADFDDHADTKRDTGSMKAESYALGAYLTHTTANGAYLDLVGQFAKLHNDFTIKTETSRDKATQKGWRAGFSVVSGYPLWKIDNAWLLEGQAQLSYQYTKYQGFKGNDYKVDAYDADTLRGRIGARLVRDMTTAENKSLNLPIKTGSTPAFSIL
jgi:outer membrane autotransporter protein